MNALSSAVAMPESVMQPGNTPMKKKKLVVVGNGMAGVRTLEELLKIAPDLYDITVFGAEPHPNYNRILLSPVLAGEQTLADIVLNPLAWYAEHGITLRMGTKATQIDRIQRVVRAAVIVPVHVRVEPPPHLADIGEALHTYDLVKAGHTDIVSIKNASSHGIDVVSRDSAGELQFDEVKASGIGKAKAQRGDPEEFVVDRIARAIDQDGHWAKHNTIPGLDDIARGIRREIMIPGITDELKPGLNTQWIQMNLSRSPGSTTLDVGKTVEDWVKPEAKKQSLLETFSPIEQGVHHRVAEKAKEKGLDDERAENLAAQGLLAFKQSRSVNRADDIGIYENRLFITSFPYGFGRDPSFHVNLEVAVASQKPAQETLQQVAQLDQQQAQARLAQQQTQQPDGPDSPKGPTIGPRIA